ncbi:prepilin-type N-terminal cleavage/methylation domain-containing protein [Neobacillus sp. YIM B02564]|jgi:competence protein ComGF|uniref:Prepilin-type N-terminal cleavage/methylation domain-containing protein n=1 Tax=Neobacillus paridis TaxID=2803862 RepID=A0ABS1TLH9_9BACI|nr:competence type IV pilus minor pilin ComGF [Neobacillus paridis]MBL4951418.1 prepilin-type N-terminal cleavage/methylation domain-containing protein [Neobacillus paridis]
MEKHVTAKLKFAANSNENAFTLVEALFALSIFSIIVFLLAPIFQIILDHRDNQIRLQEMEWEVFCSQFKKEIRLSTEAKVESGQLILTKGKDSIIYEKYETNLRRRVNFTGHEVVLQNVSQHAFELLNNAVKVTVKNNLGKEYSVIAFSLVDWKTDP